jgi:hypothetical protein
MSRPEIGLRIVDAQINLPDIVAFGFGLATQKIDGAALPRF